MTTVPTVADYILNGVKTPPGYFIKKKNRQEYLRFYIEEVLKKEGTDRFNVQVKDFKKSKVYSALITYYRGSIHKMLLEIYPEDYIDDNYSLINRFFKNKNKLPRFFWKDENNRQLTIKVLVEEILQRHPDKVMTKDFQENGLSGFLVNYYENSPSKALKQAFSEENPEGIVPKSEKDPKSI